MYYEVEIKMTSKPVGSKENYSAFHSETKQFKTVAEVKEFLKQEYAGHKKQKMYVDDKEGKPKHVGYIYCFRNSDISHNSETWLQQDWVSVWEMKAKPVIVAI